MGENYTHLWKQKKKALYGERVNTEEGENQNKITAWTSKKIMNCGMNYLQ